MLRTVALVAAVALLEAAPQGGPGPYGHPHMYPRPASRRQGPPGVGGAFPPGQFGDPMIHFRQHNNFGDFGVADEPSSGGDEDSGSGIMSIISAPRNYFNSMVEGVRNYFSEDEEEESAPSRRHRNAPRYPGQPGNFMNLGGPQFPYQNMLSNPRFQELNSVFQPPFNQFRGPMGNFGSPFGHPQMFRGPQGSFLNGPHQGVNPRLPVVQQSPTAKHAGHWTGSFSSHYKQLAEQADERPIYHVTNHDDQSERLSQHLVSSSQPQTGTPQDTVATSSSYAQQRSDSDLIPFESSDASSNPLGYVSRQDGSFVESY